MTSCTVVNYSQVNYRFVNQHVIYKKCYSFILIWTLKTEACLIQRWNLGGNDIFVLIPHVGNTKFLQKQIDNNNDLYQQWSRNKSNRQWLIFPCTRLLHTPYHEPLYQFVSTPRHDSFSIRTHHYVYDEKQNCGRLVHMYSGNEICVAAI